MALPTPPRLVAHALRRRIAVVVAALLAAQGAMAVVAACDSSTPRDPIDVDADVDGAVTPDGGREGAAPSEASVDAGGNCSAVKGPCDIVRQDCPNDAKGKRQECVVGGPSGAPVTECVAEQVSQQLPKGRACCPGTAADPGNPCLPGLSCVGQPCTDGGAPTGRCSPACCEGDDKACGNSDPEGISGACNLVLVDSQSTELHAVCSWRERCKPFKVEPCRTGQICIVEDKIGTASCVSSMGKTNRQSCTFANECADGLICSGSGDAGLCRTLCLTPGSTHPFDASVEEGGAGRGGCPAGEQCRITFSNLPPWLSGCALPDGG